MSNITSLKDLVGKRFRLKETLSKDNVMVSNHTLYIRSNNGEIIANYYYGNDSISTVNFYVGYDRYNVSALILNGNSIYNFYKNVYNEDYGNKPRIVEFLDFDINNIICGGWFGSETATDELAISYFINFWNYNTEEVNIDEALSDIGNSIRNISGKNDKIPFLKMSYELEEGLKKYVKPKGKINITNTQEIDVTQYEKAQVVDENLKAENIAEGVEVLGITGTMKGAGVSALKKLLDYTKSCYYLFGRANINTGNPEIIDLTGYLEYNDTENVSNMSYMFHNATNLKKIPLFDTSNMTSSYAMFMGCSSIEEIPIFDLSKNGNMTSTFSNCFKLKKIPQLKMNKGPNGLHMTLMFSSCYSLETIDIDYFFTDSDGRTSSWCEKCYSLKSFIIRSFGPKYLLHSGAFTNSRLESTYNDIYNPNGEKGYIYVPRNMVDTLKSATNWSTYADQIKPIFAVEHWGNGLINETTNSNNETILNAITNGSSFKGWYKGMIEDKRIYYITESSYEQLEITFPFKLNENGYYQNTNQNRDSTFSKGRFNFNIENENQKLRITYLQSSEQNYDYGVIGSVDVALADNTNTSGYTTLKGQANTTPKEVIIEDLSVGSHFIEIKYIKDSGSASGTDTLQVKVEVVTVEVVKGLNVEDTPYSVENEINIGVVDEMTMEPLSLVAVFE